MNSPELQKILDARSRLEAWIEAEDFAGYDTHDAMNSPLLGWMGRRSRWLGIGFVQVVRRTPLNLRPLLGIKKVRNPKALGVLAAAYLDAYRTWHDERHKATACSLLTWLKENTSRGYSGCCWGYPFDWPNRGFFAPAGTPTSVNTAFIANAFLDAYELMGEGEYLTVARSACDFCLRDLQVCRENDAQCFSYTPLDRRWIHNANLLVARLLARTGDYTRDARLMEESERAVNFSLRAQQPDGSWPYGTSWKDRWVDHFHTGFVLDAMADLHDLTGREDYERALRRGYEYYRAHFFRSDGLPTYYPRQPWPVDIHVVAQAILTLVRNAEHDSSAVAQARHIAMWSIEHMQAQQGYFYYQVGRWLTNRVPYLRWSQSWMLRALTALATLLITLGGRKVETIREVKMA